MRDWNERLRPVIQRWDEGKRSVTHDDLRQAVLTQRQRLDRAVADLDRQTLETAPMCGTWSARDIVGHLLDWQTVLLAAARYALGGPRPIDVPIEDGQAFNAKSSPTGSFVGFLNGGCQAIASISASSPRVPFGLSNLIPKGQSGTLSITTGPAVGLLLSPFTGPFGGIRGLHYRTFTSSALTIPIFMPVC